MPRAPLFPRFLELDPAEVVQRLVSERIEADWPTETDPNVCRHCRRKDDNLIPLGYGARPRIWVGASPLRRPLSGRSQIPGP